MDRIGSSVFCLLPDSAKLARSKELSIKQPGPQTGQNQVEQCFACNANAL